MKSILKKCKNKRNSKPPKSFVSFAEQQKSHFNMVTKVSPLCFLYTVCNQELVTKFMIESSRIAFQTALNNIWRAHCKFINYPVQNISNIDRPLSYRSLLKLIQDFMLSVVSNTQPVDIYTNEDCSVMNYRVALMFFAWTTDTSKTTNTTELFTDTKSGSDPRIARLIPHIDENVCLENGVKCEEIAQILQENLNYFLFYYTMDTLRWRVRWEIQGNTVRFYQRDLLNGGNLDDCRPEGSTKAAVPTALSSSGRQPLLPLPDPSTKLNENKPESKFPHLRDERLANERLAQLYSLGNIRNKLKPPSFAQFQNGKGCHFEMMLYASPDVLFPEIVGYDIKIKYLKGGICDLNMVKESLTATKLAQTEFIAERKKKEKSYTDRILTLQDIYHLAMNCLTSVIIKPGCLDYLFDKTDCHDMAKYVSQRLFRWNPSLRFREKFTKKPHFKKFEKRFHGLVLGGLILKTLRGVRLSTNDIISVFAMNCHFFLFYYTLHALRYFLMWQVDGDSVRFYNRVSPLPDGMSHVNTKFFGTDSEMSSLFMSELHMLPAVIDWSEPHLRPCDSPLVHITDPVEMAERLFGVECFRALQQQNSLGEEVLNCIHRVIENNMHLVRTLRPQSELPKRPSTNVISSIYPLTLLVLRSLFYNTRSNWLKMSQAENARILCKIITTCIRSWRRSEPFMSNLDFGTSSPVAVPFIEHVRKCMPNYHYLNELLHALFFNMLYFQMHYVMHWLKISTVLVEDIERSYLVLRQVDPEKEGKLGVVNEEQLKAMARIRNHEPNSDPVREDEEESRDYEEITRKKKKKKKEQKNEEYDETEEEKLEETASTERKKKKKKNKEEDEEDAELIPEKKRKRKRKKSEIDDDEDDDTDTKTERKKKKMEENEENHEQTIQEEVEKLEEHRKRRKRVKSKTSEEDDTEYGKRKDSNQEEDEEQCQIAEEEVTPKKMKKRRKSTEGLEYEEMMIESEKAKKKKKKEKRSKEQESIDASDEELQIVEVEKKKIDLIDVSDDEMELPDIEMPSSSRPLYTIPLQITSSVGNSVFNQKKGVLGGDWEIVLEGVYSDPAVPEMVKMYFRCLESSTKDLKELLNRL